jgi:adenylyltransferase/sulfurtransferase
LGIPLVSGGAISNAGQWAVYGGTYDVNGKKERRACYRCLWPSVIGGGGGMGRCDELGVWGMGVGMIGVGMAGEVVKLILEQYGMCFSILLSFQLE